MSWDFKQEYLDKKYAMHDDESDVTYRKSRHVKKSVKKSDHKHTYENVVVTDHNRPNGFFLVGRCSVCGKIGESQKDNRVTKKFANYGGMYLRGVWVNDDEYEVFKDWCKKNYPVYEIPDFNPWDYKYI